MKIDGHKIPKRQFNIDDVVNVTGFDKPMFVVGYYLWRGRRWHFYVTAHIHDHATVALAKDLSLQQSNTSQAPALGHTNHKNQNSAG